MGYTVLWNGSAHSCAGRLAEINVCRGSQFKHYNATSESILQDGVGLAHWYPVVASVAGVPLSWLEDTVQHMSFRETRAISQHNVLGERKGKT